MKRNNIIKILLVSFITLILLSIFSYTYAFFSLQIEGTGKDIVMSTGDLRLEYKDETKLKFENAVPGDTISKVITVKNIGTKNVSYSLYWGNLINTIDNYELHVTLDCKSYTNYGEETQTESGTCENIYRAVPISDTVTTGNIKGNISIDPNITHEYTVTVKFDNKNYPQNGNMNRTFTGKIGIEEYIDPAVTNCTFDGEMVQGAEYVNGQYTYRYMQEGVYSNDSSLAWVDIKDKGWGVQLTDKDSTAVAIGNVCTYINNEPVISMSYMYSGSAAESINLSSFNTSKVKNMKAMFYKVTTTTLDTSSFDTSSVTDMSYMFYSQATKIDASGFDTSNVINMSNMFSGSNVVTLDLNNFDTSKVTNMGSMFFGSKVNNLDLSNFDTSNVTDMSNMFWFSSASVIDVSGFDTSKVTNMDYMFYDSKAKTIYVSDKFVTNKVTIANSANMFTGATNLVGGNGTKYNSSHVDKTYARIDTASTPGYFTSK